MAETFIRQPRRRRTAGLAPRTQPPIIAPGRCYTPPAPASSKHSETSMRQSLTVITALVARRFRPAGLAPSGRLFFPTACTGRARQRDFGRHRLRAHPLVHALSPADGRRRGLRGGREVRRAEGARVRARGRAVIRSEDQHDQLVATPRRALTLTEPYSVVLPSRPRSRCRWPTTAGRPTSARAELVDVGAGTTDADYAGKDVAGKVVLASGIARHRR